MDDYWTEIQRPGALPINVTDIERADSDIGYITVDDKYEYLIEYVEEGNIRITYNGAIEELKPRIIKFNLTNTTHSITVDAEAKRADSYDIYLSEEQGADANPLQSDTGNTTGKYTFDGLTQDKIYYVKVVARNTNGEDSQEKLRKTGTMTAITTSELVTESIPEGWYNENKLMTARIETDKDVSLYTLQWARRPLGDTTDVKNLTWYKYTNSGIESEENETIFFRLTDGTNTTSYISRTVAGIDKVKPVVLSQTSATTNTITIKATDDSSGIIGYAITETLTKPTAFTNCSNTLSLTTTVGNRIHGSTYYVWVKDEAGNVSEYKEITMGTVTGLTNTNTSFVANTNGWTNQDVTITVSTNVVGYTLQTSKDGNTWDTTNTQTFDKNGTIYARVIDSTGQYTGVASVAVANIDKLAPNSFTASATSDTRSVTVTANTTDKAATSEYGKSDGIKYAFKLNNGNYTEYQENGTYTFDNLSQTTNYTITVRAKDNAGNITEQAVTKGTSTIPTVGSASISPTGWTNGNVTVTLPTSSGFTTRYTIDGTTPTNNSTQYSSPVEVSSNCTVKFVYTDGKNINTAGSILVANIEKTEPTVGTTIAKKSSNSSSIVTTLKTIDEGTGLSKIVYYYKLSTASNYTSVEEVYTAMNGNTKGVTTEQTKEHTFSGLQQGKIYNFYAEIYDVAGNKTRTPESETLDITTGQVSTLTITAGTATASGKPITITAANDNVSVIRYTLDGTTPTTSSQQYTGEFKILKNCTIKAIAYDSTGQEGAVASLAVTIDLGNAESSHVRAGYKFMSNNTNQQYVSGTMENKSGYKITLVP